MMTLVFTASCQKTEINQKIVANKLDSLLSVKSYFKAKELFEESGSTLQKSDRLRFSATILNLFNDIDISKQQINSLLEKDDHGLSRQALKDILDIQLSNSVKSFDYQMASQISKKLTQEFTDVIGEEELWSIKNNDVIWEALSSYPEQSVVFSDDTHIKLFRDAVGLKNLNVQVGKDDHPFIFDTGANLSAVIESQARAMGVEIIDVNVSVNTITGQLVDSKIGISSQLQIGNLTYRNVVFLVFPDEALFVPQLNYQIKGILGFPVIEAMNEVHFLKNDKVFVPKNSVVRHEQNMAIEFLSPIINLETASGDMHFTFDSGATRTSLYKAYFDKHKESILANYKETDVSFAGAAGDTTVRGYYVEFLPKINDSLVSVRPVAVLHQSMLREDFYSFGNIGQDLVSKFDKMIMNFEQMFIRFE